MVQIVRKRPQGIAGFVKEGTASTRRVAQNGHAFLAGMPLAMRPLMMSPRQVQASKKLREVVSRHCPP